MRLFACSIVLALFVGCGNGVNVAGGTNVSGGVTLADAYDDCNLYQILSLGRLLTESEFNVGIIDAEAFRDDGGSKSAHISRSFDACIEVESDVRARDQCFVCWTNIAAAVWP